MNRLRRKSSGFILLTAILMIAIVALALVSMTAAASSRSRRQSSDLQQAQLEQLLLAGTREALNRFNSAIPPKANESFEVELPEALASVSNLRVHVEPAAVDGDVVASVRATMNGHTASETIHLTKTASAWGLKSASLD